MPAREASGVKARRSRAPYGGVRHPHLRMRALRLALHYALLVAIALVCAFPFLWTLSAAVGTQGNVFSFPSSFVPQRPSLANFIEVFRVVDLGRYYWNSIWITFWTVAWTVLVCSLTTVFGSLSLLVSDNLAIRGFGLASLIGELTCVIAAFAIVPAIIALPRLAPRTAFAGDPASSRV